jgi:death-on-curing protein
MDIITAAILMEIHDELIKASGGSAGVLSTGTLDHISFECNRKSDCFRKAAAALHGIVTQHPFFDGNKRTGLAVAYLILIGYGYGLHADQENIVEFLLQVANYRIDENGVNKWLRENTFKV